MPQTSDGPKPEETPTKPKEQPTCSLCRSPLIGEAIKTGKCQCCGHTFDPKAFE